TDGNGQSVRTFGIRGALVRPSRILEWVAGRLHIISRGDCSPIAIGEVSRVTHAKELDKSDQHRSDMDSQCHICQDPSTTRETSTACVAVDKPIEELEKVP